MSVIIRKRLPFAPTFDCKSIAGWAYTTSVDMLWRCYPEYELDDLMGEAQLAFVKVLRAYPDVDNIQHFAALFRRTFLNQITSIANKRSRKVGINITDLASDEESIESLEGATADDGLGDSAFKPNQAPPRVRKLIEAFVSTPEKGGMVPRPLYIEKGSRRVKESLNEFLCRVAGVENLDLVGEVLDWVRFGEATV